MALGHRKTCLNSFIGREMQIKLNWDNISHRQIGKNSKSWQHLLSAWRARHVPMLLNERQHYIIVVSFLSQWDLTSKNTDLFIHLVLRYTQISVIIVIPILLPPKKNPNQNLFSALWETSQNYKIYVTIKKSYYCFWYLGSMFFNDTVIKQKLNWNI